MIEPVVRCCRCGGDKTAYFQYDADKGVEMFWCWDCMLVFNKKIAEVEENEDNYREGS